MDKYSPLPTPFAFTFANYAWHIRIRRIFIKDHPITVIDFSKYLGLLFDRKLTFRSHVMHLCQKCERPLYLLRMLSQYVVGQRQHRYAAHLQGMYSISAGLRKYHLWICEEGSPMVPRYRPLHYSPYILGCLLQYSCDQIICYVPRAISSTICSKHSFNYSFPVLS